MLGTTTIYGRVTALVESWDGRWYRAVDRAGRVSLVAVEDWSDIRAKHERKGAS